MSTDRYRGDGMPLLSETKLPFPYRADTSLARAVNMAIALQRPLLVKGAPGCGKTKLAESIAHELGLPLYRWYIKSTSRAMDGLYTIDMVRRLQDAQLDDPRAQEVGNYVRFGKLGEALKGDREAVVLIDEIDKADIDFPNDLLRELEEKAFTIEELDGEEIVLEDGKVLKKNHEAVSAPIIVITSNDEKELPDAFLRRCLFHHIDFPDPTLLAQIVQVNVESRGLKVNETLIQHAAQRLHEIREVDGFRKDPATSELIDWVRILHHWGVEPDELEKIDGLTDLPYWEVLFKHRQDQQRLERAVEEARS